MAEIGLDSQRNGVAAQAETLDWQLRTIFAAGCGGCFVFAWTDEWYRGGSDIEDWDFGLTSRQRQPKPALAAIVSAFAEAPFPPSVNWPRISVAVCSYNGARTIRDTLEGLQRLDYPDYEVIVVDDGSSDGVADIAREYASANAQAKIYPPLPPLWKGGNSKSKIVRVIVHPQNLGLSCARNTALEAATGEIIAYIDDDAYPDSQWLTYLAATFLAGEWAGVGGPNLPPPDDGPVADCVANAPGGPIHVLLSDREAEHIPGCNMAYWKSRLQAIGGFDPRFRAAGDDVDICWRLQERGWHIGFSPAAFVWHHRRNSVKAYWKQQWGYGKAEALLEEKWPQRYKEAGHVSWSGRLYGKGLVQLLGWPRGRIYHGTWGSALFQSLYQSEPGLFAWLPAMPEWYLILLLLAGLSVLGVFWPPLLLALPALTGGIAVLLLQAAFSAYRATFPVRSNSRLPRLKRYGLTALLYLLQPMARLWGRFDRGLTPWRRRGNQGFAFPGWRQDSIWSESWRSPENWLEQLESRLESQGAIVRRGSDFDRWDLEVRGGLLGSVCVLLAIEEHGGGRQLARFRCWPRVAALALAAIAFLLVLAMAAVGDGAVLAAAGLVLSAGILTLTAFRDCAAAMACYKRSQ
jgi:cellulose synthase/poly-beta-1,6-N-acetylglucosamine synthase-like glycosyltransferase